MIHISKIRKRDIGALLVFILIGWQLLLLWEGGLISRTEHAVYTTVDHLANFIREHHGEFPDDRKLRELADSNEFPNVVISRVADLENIVFKGGRLIDSATLEEVFFIRGLEASLIGNKQRQIYRNASVGIYIELIKQKSAYGAGL